ncbi:MAG TPA: hypothetical protein VES01_04135 [Dermatophilaceae bacterium]|nr:hypothetical protein [Dermatophilaceae bacterium]
MTREPLTTELVAVLVALLGEEPQVLTVGADGAAESGPSDATAMPPALPSGPLQASHRSLQSGLRAWVEAQTGRNPGYVEQLYTFADVDRAGANGRILSVSYLGLTAIGDNPNGWRHWYEFFPWEDRRDGRGQDAHEALARRLRDWAAEDPARSAVRWQRCAIGFGLEGHGWSPELCLQRYELLYESGLLPESARRSGPPVPGLRLRYDHRRILATGLARLRAKIQYRPVVFELMPAVFTLGQLQGAVEALAGRRVHKQNFRRLVEQQDLVEDTGERTTDTGGRPAKMVRFRREVHLERQAAGTKLPIPRSR